MIGRFAFAYILLGGVILVMTPARAQVPEVPSHPPVTDTVARRFAEIAEGTSAPALDRLRTYHDDGDAPTDVAQGRVTRSRKVFEDLLTPDWAGSPSLVATGGVMSDATPDTVAIRPSPIEGLGLFALRRFADSERIRTVNVVREITVDAPLRPELGERSDHCDYPDGRIVLIGPPDRHLNHSCDPNAWVRYRGTLCEIVACREIRAGQEITCGYRINAISGDSWPCRCGAARCQGQVAGVRTLSRRLVRPAACGRAA